MTDSAEREALPYPLGLLVQQGGVTLPARALGSTIAELTAGGGGVWVYTIAN